MPHNKNAAFPVNFSRIASELLFGGTLDLAKHGVVYRKGKTPDDIQAAVRKALHPRNGRGKTEFELEMLELYLKDVLKVAKPSPMVAQAGV